MSQFKRQSGSYAFAACPTCKPQEACDQGFSSKNACKNCDNRNFPTLGNSLVLDQTFVGQGPTMLDLMYPNQPAAGFRAGQQAYQKARGNISSSEFYAEQANAFSYFQQRYGLPTTYFLTAILSYIDATDFTPAELAAANLLGLPLYTITYVDANGATQLWGFYRPEVYCEDLTVGCLNTDNVCQDATKFRKVLMAEHVIYIASPPVQQAFAASIQDIATPVSTITINDPTPSEYIPVINGQAVPPRVYPQFFQDISTIFSLPSAVYGYATLVSGPSANLKTTEIIYRSLYAVYLNLSVSCPSYTAIPAGPFQGALNSGFPCQASSCQLSNGDFNGTMLIQRGRDIRGNSANNLTADPQPIIPYPIVFDPNGGWLILTQGVSVVFPQSHQGY